MLYFQLNNTYYLIALRQYPSSSYLSSTIAVLQLYTVYQLIQYPTSNYLIALCSTLAQQYTSAANYYLVYVLAYKSTSNGPRAVPQQLLQQLPQQYYGSTLAVHSILAFTALNNLAVLAVLKYLATLDLRKTSNRSITKYQEILNCVYYAEQLCIYKDLVKYFRSEVLLNLQFQVNVRNVLTIS